MTKKEIKKDTIMDYSYLLFQRIGFINEEDSNEEVLSKITSIISNLAKFEEGNNTLITEDKEYSANEVSYRVIINKKESGKIKLKTDKISVVKFFMENSTTIKQIILSYEEIKSSKDISLICSTKNQIIFLLKGFLENISLTYEINEEEVPLLVADSLLDTIELDVLFLSIIYKHSSVILFIFAIEN